MTTGQLFEAVIGKHKAVTGETLADATVFNKLDTEGICKALHSVGYQKHGNEVMYHGATGKPIKSMIFIGPTYYQRLKHLVADKIHSRSRGLVTNLYRQPMEGRSRDGGLRFGEMEKDATLAHGAMQFLREKMLNLSDRCSVPVCNACGLIAIYNKKKSDTVCRGCSSKDVSMCVLPYVCKLLFQDLMAMNIAPRISVKQN